MKDSKFSAEYKNSVNSVALPADYKSKILSALREQAKLMESEKTTDSPETLNTPETNTETYETKTQIISIEDAKKTKTKSYKNFLRTLPAVAAAVVVLVGALLLLNLGINTVPNTKDFNFTIASATNLANIKGAKLTFKDSNGNLLTDKDGTPLTAYTDEKGNATVALPEDGTYNAEVTINGFIPREVPADGGYIYVSPVMDENTYRAVLTWENECDLDAILTVTQGEKREQLFYFNSNIFDDNGELIAALDTDSAEAGAPETITFNATKEGTFRFSVASYSSLKNDDRTDLQRSGAQVTLYKGDKIVDTYNLPPNTQGNAWCVFEVKDSKLINVNTTYSVNAMTEVK